MTTPKEKAIEYFMQHEVGLLDEGEKPSYPLQLDNTITVALKARDEEIKKVIDNFFIPKKMIKTHKALLKELGLIKR